MQSYKNEGLYGDRQFVLLITVLVELGSINMA